MSADASSADNVKVRIFLSAYLIALFPNEVFEKQHDLEPVEKSLLEISARLSIRFERILRLSVQKGDFRRVPAELTVDFVPMIFTFMRLFLQWKEPSERNFSQRVVNAMTALDDSLSVIPDDTTDPERLRCKAELQEQLARLEQKLRCLSGGIEALALFEERRRKKAEERARQPSMDMGVRPSNEQYAHELFLNPSFRLDSRYMGAITAEELAASESVQKVIFFFVDVIDGYEQLTTVTLQVFWESLEHDLCSHLFSVPSSPCWSRVLRLLVEIRDDFCGLVDGPNALAMKELVDTELIRQQMQVRGCFGQDDWYSLVRQMRDLIHSAQKTPQRAAELQAKWGSRSSLQDSQPAGRLLCEALKLLLDDVRILMVDVVNERFVYVNRFVSY